jgi:Fic family protein
LWYHVGVEDVRARVAAKKAELDRVRAAAEKSLAALSEWYDVELTYTSNAIEGNTLTRVETAEVFEKGLASPAVVAKPIEHQLEVIGHKEALAFVHELARRADPFKDGNGRTARLMMNLSLMRAGYSPVVIGPKHRVQYLDSLQKLQLEQDSRSYKQFLYERLEASLEDYLARLRGGAPKCSPM